MATNPLEFLELSPKQYDYVYDSLAFLNIAHGAVRSGKTYCNLYRFAVHTQVAPPGDLMMLGRTRETIERNAINPLKDLMGPSRVRYNRGLGIVWIGNRPVWVVGVNDTQAESKIRGSTLAGSYINEVTVLQEHAFDQLYDRHSVEGAKMFGDTNPDSPFHWLKRKWLDNEALTHEDLYALHFALTDNPFLPPSYVQRLMRSHVGLWYKRMILGQWVQAEGAIYEQWDENAHVVDAMPAAPDKVIIGVDHGQQNATVFLALGRVLGRWYVFAEYYHSGRDTGRQKTIGEYGDDFWTWLNEDVMYYPAVVLVDPAAQAFLTELRHRKFVRRVTEADNTVIDGIQKVSTALTDGTLKVLRRCEHTREEFPSYAWDPKAQEKGEDKPIKANDHCLDTVRYCGNYVFGRP